MSFFASTLSAVVLSLSLFATPQAYAIPKILKSCVSALRGASAHHPAFFEFDENYVDANGVAVTGEDYYPTDIVIQNLGLDAETLGLMKGKKVVSVGEGFSGLTPWLRENGIPARGMDVWYSNTDFPDNPAGRMMAAYVAKHKKHLVTGDAIKMPFKNRSVDFLVSHMLVNNLDFQEVLVFMIDALRVVKSGGQIRVFGFSEGRAKLLVEAFNSIFSHRGVCSVEEKTFSFEFEGEIETRTDYLFVVKVK